MSAEAASALERLATDDGVDERVRWCAQLYLASARLVGGQRAEVLRALEGYPSDATMSPLVLERDRVVMWSMLLERAHRGEAPEETLQIAAGLYDAAVKAAPVAQGASSMPDVKTPAGAAAIFARVRAMEVARRLIKVQVSAYASQVYRSSVARTFEMKGARGKRVTDVLDLLPSLRPASLA